MILIRKFRSLFNPEFYQGWGRTRKYFEGWYFKVINASGTKTYAFIPGIAMDENGNRQAFVQVLDGQNKESEFHSFNASLFIASPGKFELTIGNNYFSASQLILDLPSVKGELGFSPAVTWPGHWYSPGIMGPYTFVPFMECNHGIVSMDHSITGSLVINGKETDFTGGRGYTEKDWGHSFPSAYIWMQSNHFESEGISFKVSVARIPWLTGSFTGFIAGLWFDNTLFRFTTYNRSSLMKLSFNKSTIQLEIVNKSHLLKITAPFDKAATLAAPVRGLMDGRIEESMTSTVDLMLSERKSKKIIFNGKGRNASIEVSGDLETLTPR